MVQFFEDFIEEKGFINFFVLVICYNLYLIDFSDVDPVPVCDQYIHVSSTYDIENSDDHYMCQIVLAALSQLLYHIYLLL